MDKSALPLLDMQHLPTLAEIRAKPVRISCHSLFTDDVWYLDGKTPGHTKAHFAIHWDVVADQNLIDGLKYLAALLFLERDGRRIYKHSTASTFSAGARHLLRFMNAHGYSTFKQFDPDEVKRFKKRLYIALSDPREAEKEQDEPDEEIAEDVYHSVNSVSDYTGVDDGDTDE